MDRSLDEIIAERPQRQNRNRRPQGGQGRRRDGVKKPYREDRVDLDLDWVHDKYEDNRDSRSSRSSRRTRGDRYSPPLEHSASAGAKIRVENIHYDITESDLEELFARIGPINNVSLVYDRAGRSEGLAFVTYNRASDARTAISEFDGANAKGQPIRMTLISSDRGRRDRNPFDSVVRPKGSLFDRVERPRDSRSLSPESGSESNEHRRHGGRRSAAVGRGGGGGAGAGRRSDVSKPPPDHIDRYVPGQQRSPVRRTGTSNRRPGDGNRNSNRNPRSDGRNTANGRPRKTQEELDQEMDDYWGSGAASKDAGAEPQQQGQQNATVPAATAGNGSAGAGGDDDVDMIE